MFSIELTTPNGRRFLLAPFGWTPAANRDPRVIRVPTRAEARRILNRAWKGHPGDKVRTIAAEVQQ